MGPITGHKKDYNGAGALRGQRHIPSKTEPKYPPPPPRDLQPVASVGKQLVRSMKENVRKWDYEKFVSFDWLKDIGRVFQPIKDLSLFIFLFYSGESFLISLTPSSFRYVLRM